MSKKILLTISAIAAGGLLHAAPGMAIEPAGFAKVDEFLDQGGSYYMVYDPESLKAEALKQINGVAAEFSSASDSAKTPAEMMAPVIVQNVKQFLQASGASRLGCTGQSAVPAGEYNGMPFYRIKSRTMIGAAGKPDFIGAFSSGSKFDMNAIGELPGSVCFALAVPFDADIFYQALKRISAFAMFSARIESDFQNKFGFPLAELLASLNGEFLVAYMMNDGEPGAIVTVPDKNGKVAIALAAIAEDLREIDRLTVAPGKDEVSLFFNCPASFRPGAVPAGMRLADNDQFKAMISGLPTDGNIFFYMTPGFYEFMTALNGTQQIPLINICGAAVTVIEEKHWDSVANTNMPPGYFSSAIRLCDVFAGALMAYADQELPDLKNMEAQGE